MGHFPCKRLDFLHRGDIMKRAFFSVIRGCE